MLRGLRRGGAAPPSAPVSLRRQRERPSAESLAHARREARARILRLGLVLVAVSVLSPLFTSLTPTKAYAVATGSMEPLIPTGSLVVAGPGEVGVGTVVVYWTPVGNAHEIHRVREVRQVGNETHYLTRGDANEASDSFSVAAEDVRGVYYRHVPWLGHLWLLGTVWQAVAFAALLGAYLGLTAWEARPLLRARLAPGAVVLALLVVSPAAWAAVGPSWPAATVTAGVAATPLPFSAGTMASAAVSADGNRATVTAAAPKLWKEVVLWPCDIASGCAVALPGGAYVTVAGSIVRVDAAAYSPAATLYLEAYLKAPSGQTASVILRNKTDGSDVAGSEVSTTSTAPVLVRSVGFTLSGAKDYQMRMRHTGSGSGGELSMAKLLVEQQFPTKTETQVRISSADETSGLSWTVPGRAGKFRWDASAWDGVTAAYVEFVANSGLTDGRARLVDRTSGAVVHTHTFLTSSPTRFRSGDIRADLVDGHEYEVEIASVLGGVDGTTQLYSARILVQQSSFTKTVRYVDLSWTTSTTSTSFTAKGYHGRYHMDSEWGGVTGYLEVTMKNSGSSGTSSARLLDQATGAAVAGSQVDITGTARTRARSAAATLDVANVAYAVQLKATSGTNEVRSAWLLVQQTQGKTYDHALRSGNGVVDACTWSFTLQHAAATNLSRLATAKVALRGDGGALADQVVVSGGSVTQATGAAVSVAFGGRAEHVVTTGPTSAGASTLEADLRGTCAGSGIRTVQRVTYALA